MISEVASTNLAAKVDHTVRSSQFQKKVIVASMQVMKWLCGRFSSS